MVTTVGELTAAVVIVNACENMKPAPAITVAGTAAAGGFELDNAIVAFPGGAGPVRITWFAVTEVPPVTLVWLSRTEEGVAGFTVRRAGLVTPL